MLGLPYGDSTRNHLTVICVEPSLGYTRFHGKTNRSGCQLPIELKWEEFFSNVS